MARYVPAGSRSFGGQTPSLNSALSVLYAQAEYSTREQELRKAVGQRERIYTNITGRSAAWGKAATRVGEAYKEQNTIVNRALHDYEKAAQEVNAFKQGLQVARKKDLVDEWRAKYGTRFIAAKQTASQTKSEWKVANDALQSIYGRYTGIQSALKRSGRQAEQAYNVYQQAVDRHSRWTSYGTGFPTWVGNPAPTLYSGQMTSWQGRQ